ncbi:O-antigen ligase family protein [Maribacter sp. ANRC-HE7]|uniref:O-antigen ligase family protein n=1 Tax=Maribacter aquimaris TaxID=2737171 RepID=A0ABR7V4K3_9FLAO|nr:O-antigen ligase family protein [Maribacter aquimaris]MBD0779698.1 O-antigen ligase family protein [Maribacter aquimaris]
MKKKNLIVLILIFGLVGTTTNIIYVSPIPSLVALTLFSVSFLLIKRINRVIFATVLFFLASVISVLVYYPESFLEFLFYRYDGNFIISYAPLLFFPLFSYRFNIDKLLSIFLTFIVLLNFIIYVLGLGLENYSGAFKGLFYSTNAAGGFLSIICTLLIVKFQKHKNIKTLLLIFISLFLLYATKSRGSLLGLILGGGMFYLWKINKAWIIKYGILAIILVQIVILSNTYPVYEKHQFTSQTLRSYIVEKEGLISGKKMNIYLRAYQNWPRGLMCFFYSPLIGTGFGSVNDLPFKFDNGYGSLVNFNQQKTKVFSSHHAHHSYLHILGEQGILGFAIFIYLLSSIYSFLRKNAQSTFVQESLLFTFFNLIIMSFTEHRLTSPSNALPFVLIFCLYYIYVNGIKKEHA